MEDLKLINEKTHPIENIWIVKNMVLWSPLYALTPSFLFKRFDLFLFIAGLIIVPAIIYAYLSLAIKNYHYEFGEKLIVLKQGVISKSQRTVIYGRIQNVTVSQGPLNRLLGLATITLETASEGAGVKLFRQESQNRNYTWQYSLGFYSNRVGMPGMLREKAIDLRDTIMRRMKENPIDDAQSGL